MPSRLNQTMEMADQGGEDDDGSVGDSHYETQYQRSLRHYLTREALPVESNYRNVQSVLDGTSRPTLDELHNATCQRQEQVNMEEGTLQEAAQKLIVKFGWMKGVLMVCLLNIWGVMLFLRISWVVAQCGLLEALGVIIIANIVTLITSLSMSAIATNGLIEGGGVYYMISRSLGPEFGGSIGLMFTVANSIAVATYIIGFVNSLQDMVYYYFDQAVMFDGGENDVRIVGTITLLVLAFLAVVGMKYVQMAQMGLLFLLIAAQVDFVIGAFMGPQSDEAMARGFVGLNHEVLKANLFNDYRRAEGQNQGVASTFAVFFPAVTGITAGANLSGDLKDPSKAIPRGTLSAISITFTTYIGYPILLAASVIRDASGNVEVFRQFYYNDTGFLNGSKSILDNPVFTRESCSKAGEGVVNPYNPNITTCEFGSMNNFQIMELVSAWGPLIYAGCFAATLSSAIASLVGAPRVLQALAKDKLYPGLFIFAKGYGANNDPVNGYFLVFLISLGCIMIGNLNAVSTLLSNFFLASYCLINISCFHASLIKSPGWRPSFKFYNKWVSLAGGFMCLIVMFMVDPWTALGTFVVVIILYAFVSYRKPNVNWGSSTQAAIYKSSLESTLNLQRVEEHVKNYRPSILVLTGPPSSRPPLLDFAHLLTKNVALLTCGHIIRSASWTQRSQLIRCSYDWMARHKIRAFYDLVQADDIEKGATDLMQLSGIGKLRPNIVMLGFKSNWQKCDRTDLKSYFNTLHCALNLQFAVAILRVPTGINFSEMLEDPDLTNSSQNGGLSPISEAVDPTTDTEEPPSIPESPAVGQRTLNVTPKSKRSKKARRGTLSDLYLGKDGTTLPKDVLNNITLFQRKQNKGTIDVWWLYDDGGLTILLPYILTTRNIFSSCKLRIFTLGNRKEDLDKEKRSMAKLLAKFRIDYDGVIVVPGAISKAADASWQEFNSLIAQFKTTDDTGDGCTLTEEELIAQKEKTNRHLRLKELMVKESRDANLVIMTLPMPRKDQVSASLYMAWLEHISRDMPPFMYVRGNQQSVLTFYS